MNELVIRAATLDDARDISALVQRTVPLSNQRDYSAEFINAIVENFTATRIAERLDKRITFIAILGNRIVGTIALGDGLLRSLFVGPKCRARASAGTWLRTSNGTRTPKGSKSSGFPRRSRPDASTNASVIE